MKVIRILEICDITIYKITILPFIINIIIRFVYHE